MIRAAQPCDRDRARRPCSSPSTGTAFAGIGITGANVKNDSLSGLDVRNGSLTTLDVEERTALLPVDFKKLPSGRSRSGGPCGAAGACPARQARKARRALPASAVGRGHSRSRGHVRQLLAEDRRSLMPARQEAPRRGRTATPPASSAAADRDSGVVRGRRRHLARRRRRDKPDRSQLGAGRHDHLRDGRLGRGATYRAANGPAPGPSPHRSYDAVLARGSTTSGTSRPSASSERHSGHASTPRSRSTNSLHTGTRGSLRAPARRAPGRACGRALSPRSSSQAPEHPHDLAQDLTWSA